jgi:uncharacterized membrane protein
MKKYFFTGLATLLPVAITVWVVVFIVRFLTRPFMGIVTHFLSEMPNYGIWTSERGIRIASEIIILIFLVLFTFLLGLIARRFFFDALLKLGDRILNRIPLVNKVYKTSKDIINSLFASKDNSLKQVVLLPFPYKDSYCIALIAANSPKTCSDPLGHPLVSVFIPTTPNPMTGFLVMIPKEELIYLDMTVEEAIKYVVSCAVIKPNFSRQPS